MIAIRGHFDGKVIVPDEPISLPEHTSLIIRIESASGAGIPDVEPPEFGGAIAHEDHREMQRVVEGDVDSAWTNAIAREWSDELSDPREDIYTLKDGEPINVTR